MEIRRIEGILLQHAIEQSQSTRAQKAGEELSIKVLSTVPDVLLELTSGGEGTVKARVSYSGGNMLTLTLSNGFEITAENKSSFNLKVGDTVELTLSNANPLTFKVTSLHRPMQTEELLNLIFKGDDTVKIPLEPENIKAGIENSGVLYERKLLDLFLGKLKPEELLKDTKAKLIQSILPYAETLSKILGVNYEKSLEGIRNLFEGLKLKLSNYEKASTAIRILMFQNMPKDYANFIIEMEARGENVLLNAIRQREAPTFIKELFSLLNPGKTEGYQTLQEAMKGLQGLNEPAMRKLFEAVKGASEREEYVSFMIEMKARGENVLLNAIKERDAPVFIKELFRLFNSGKIEGYDTLQKAIKDLQGLDEPAIREFFKAVETGSEKDIRETYKGVMEFLEKGEKLSEFYQLKGNQMENLLSRLELITHLQWSALNQQYIFHIPFYHERGKGNIIIKGSSDYTVVFNLDYEVNFIGGFMKMPKNSKVVDTKLYTDIPILAERLRMSERELKGIIEEEGLKLRNFSVELVQRDKFVENLRDIFTQEGFLLLA